MLNRKQHYLQIALNSTLDEAKDIISRLPLDERIIIEAGTPLIKAYGGVGIQRIREYWTQRVLGYSAAVSSQAPPFSIRFDKSSIGLLGLLLKAAEKKRGVAQASRLKSGPAVEKQIPLRPYIVADLKCMDRGAKEVEIAVKGEASAATCLGQAPIETIDTFIEECEEYGLDSMVDMMNVEFPLAVLRKLKKLPQVVILHRGVDEESFNPEKEIPYHEIQRIKNAYDIMIAVAGGDTFEETRRAIFNDADIVVVWKSFYKSTAETASLAEEFLKEIR